MKQFKSKPLNSKGFAHFIVPVLVIVAIGGIGTYLYSTSHADALASCQIGGMPKRSSTLPQRPVLKVTNMGNKRFQPVVEISSALSDGRGHGRGGADTYTFGYVAPNTTRNFVLTNFSGGSWAADDADYVITATSTNPSFTCTAKTEKTASAEVNKLVSILTALENNTAQARVTASNVIVAGPVGDAKARPIGFTFNGVNYYAYSQGQAPDFTTTTPLGLANSMSLVSLSGSFPRMTSAHLDKSNNLVDANGAAVGFSTGDN